MNNSPLDKTPLVAVYGTLKRGFGNHRVLQDAGGEFVAIARSVTPFPLVVSGLPYLLDRPGEGYQVEVELYRVSTLEGLRRLDRLEGHPDFYRRRVEAFKQEDGTAVDAWVYFLARGSQRLDGLEPVVCYGHEIPI